MATPLDSRTFRHRKTYLVTPSVILYRESFDSRLQVQGLTPAGMFGFTIPLQLGPRSNYWHAPYSASGLPASMPGAVDALVDAGQTHLIVLISLERLREMLPEYCVSDLECAASRRLLPVAPEDAHRLGHWLLEVLDEALQRPQLLDHDRTVRSLEDELVQRVVAACRPLCAVRLQPDRSLRRRGLERALDLLRAADPGTLTVPELCRLAGVSQRTLEYAFRDNFALTAQGFLRLQRFHTARRSLATSGSSDTTVADVAHKLGFFRFGRFAGEYRSLFGELPSQTLARTPIDTTSPLVLQTHN